MHRDADCKVDLLTDIRALFDAKCMPDDYKADRFPSKALLDALHATDDSDWCEFRGVRGDDAPHRLRHSFAMGAFSIRTRTIWPPGDRSKVKSVKGYQREQFEVTWTRYCSTPAQTAHPNNIRNLRPAGSGTV